MIQLASVKCLLKRGKYGYNKACKHNGLLGKDTVFSMVSMVSNVPAGTHGSCDHQSIPSSLHLPLPLPPRILNWLTLLFAKCGKLFTPTEMQTKWDTKQV